MLNHGTIRGFAARNRKRFFITFAEVCWIDARRRPGDLAKSAFD
jgi:hypothetical protein